MKLKYKIEMVVYLMLIVLLMLFVLVNHPRHQTSDFYQAINEWELSPVDSMIWSGEVTNAGLIFEFDTDPDTFEDLYLMSDVTVYVDQFGGNTYLINAKGDTIFKYTKEKLDEKTVE